MSNKIKYGLKSVHYAIATITEALGVTSVTYGEPVAMPGAVSLSMEPQGENSPFYADNIIYWPGINNNGYEGDLELAVVPDSFKTDVLGYKEDGKGVLVEDANAAAVHFALLFQFEGDEKATRHVLYNCTAARPAASGNTKGETVEPQTESLTITATPIWNATLGTEIVKGSTKADTDTTTYSSWFESVHLPTAPSTTP